jgi:ethanolaminephosphotransferase
MKPITGMSPKEETMNPVVNKSTSSSSSSAAAAAAFLSFGGSNTNDCDSSVKSTQNSKGQRNNFFYLSPAACENLPRFQYKGQDRSLLYAHVLSPLAQFCVDHLTPRWIAPNLITLIGLLFMISSYAIMWYYAATMLLLENVSPPRWIYLWNAICIFIYQTLDNIDGKQARRTGSSSPLGLLFDHGCDAVNSLFGSTGWMICMQLHLKRDALQCFIVLFGPYALFYIGTWEEYYTGQLIMPIVNGPNEGLLGAILMSLTSYVKGPDFWQATTGWAQFVLPLMQFLAERFPLLAARMPQQALRNADLLVLMATFGFLQEILQKVVFVTRKYGRNAVATLLPFATLVLCCLLVAWTELDVWINSPRTSLHLCATLFVEAVTDLMLQHTTEQQYQSIRWIQLPLVLFTAGVTCGLVGAGELAKNFLLVYTTAAIVYLSMKTRIAVHEICCLLNIWCFDIVSPRHASKSTMSKTVANGHIKLQ